MTEWNLNVTLRGPLNVYCLGFWDKCLLKWCSKWYWSNPIIKTWPLCCDWRRLVFLQLKFTDKFMTDVTDVTMAEMVVMDVTEMWFYDGIFLTRIVSMFQSSAGKNKRLCMWETSLSLPGHVTDISSIINNWTKGWSLGAGTPVIYDGIFPREGKVYAVPKYTAKTVI